MAGRRPRRRCRSRRGALPRRATPCEWPGPCWTLCSALRAPPVAGKAVSSVGCSAYQVLLAEDVVVDGRRIRLRLFFDLLMRKQKLRRVAGAHLVHLRAADQLAFLEALFEAGQAIGLVIGFIRSARRAVSVQTRENRLQQERLALAADILHGLGNLTIGHLRIVAVDGL